MAGFLHETSELGDRYRVLVDPESVDRHDPHWTLLGIEALRAHPEAAPRHFDHVFDDRGCLHRSRDYAALPGSRITWSASTTRLTTRPARTASARDARRRPARCAANPAQNPSEIDSGQTTMRIPSPTEAPAANAATKIASGGAARRSIRDSPARVESHSRPVSRRSSSMCWTRPEAKACEMTIATTGPTMTTTTSGTLRLAQPL